DYTVVINDDPLPLPEADISTGFLNFEAMQGTSDVDAFDVINHGEGRLVFDIRRAWAAGIQVPRTQIGNQAERASLLQTRVNDRERMQAMGQFHTLQRADTVGVATTGVSAGVYLPFGEYISQMASDVPEALNGVACGDSDAGTTSDNSW